MKNEILLAVFLQCLLFQKCEILEFFKFGNLRTLNEVFKQKIEQRMRVLQRKGKKEKSFTNVCLV
jgi:hypothetical protein